jgi:hypothetical protein
MPAGGGHVGAESRTHRDVSLVIVLLNGSGVLTVAIVRRLADRAAILLEYRSLKISCAAGKDSTMRWIIIGLVLPASLAATWLILRHSMRQIFEVMQADQAREQFRLRREGMEARFLGALARIDPDERLRWEDAHWHDEVVWARDRQTRRFLALVWVHFDADPTEPKYADHPSRPATIVFEHYRGRWHAEGKRLDEIRPDEAFLQHQRFEPILLPDRRS